MFGKEKYQGKRLNNNRTYDDHSNAQKIGNDEKTSQSKITETAGKVKLPQSRVAQIWHEYGYLVKTVIIVFVLFRVILQLAYVPSGSMETTIPTDSLIISVRLPYLVSDPTPERGDIVTFWDDELGKQLIKRVVGLPGDTISFQEGYTYINGELLDESYLPAEGNTYCDETFTVPEGCLFMMGDNRTNSEDSRFLNQPYISVNSIRAHAYICIPLAYLGKIPYPLLGQIHLLA